MPLASEPDPDGMIHWQLRRSDVEGHDLPEIDLPEGAVPAGAPVPISEEGFGTVTGWTVFWWEVS